MYRMLKLTVTAILLHFIQCSLVKYIFQPFVQAGRKTDCTRINYDIYGKTSRIEEGVTTLLFQRIANVTRFIAFFLHIFFVREFINIYTL